ncbi:hypothetical protein [Desulfosediminicola flagellatus]|uniref:hypothetical protein n=1 Tax=Desulfosediminicola flagellatus TaxID=2569541 RepID=UPI0010ABDF11|nr:hypothetical protein [Desulfosediminicola flagellatus]
MFRTSFLTSGIVLLFLFFILIVYREYRHDNMVCVVVLAVAGNTSELSLEDKEWIKVAVQSEKETMSVSLDQQMINGLKNSGYEVAAGGFGTQGSTAGLAGISTMDNEVDLLYWLAEKKVGKSPFFLLYSVDSTVMKDNQSFLEWFTEFEEFFYGSGLARKSILLIRDDFKAQNLPGENQALGKNKIFSYDYVMLPDILKKKTFSFTDISYSEGELLHEIFGLASIEYN